MEALCDFPGFLTQLRTGGINVLQACEEAPLMQHFIYLTELTRSSPFSHADATATGIGLVKLKDYFFIL